MVCYTHYLLHLQIRHNRLDRSAPASPDFAYAGNGTVSSIRLTKISIYASPFSAQSDQYRQIHRV